MPCSRLQERYSYADERKSHSIHLHVGRPLPSSCPGLTSLCPASAVTFTTPHAIRRASHSPLCLWFARARLYQLWPVVPGWCVPAGAERPFCPRVPDVEPTCARLYQSRRVVLGGTVRAEAERPLCAAGACPPVRSASHTLRVLHTCPPNNGVQADAAGAAVNLGATFWRFLVPPRFLVTTA